MEDRSRTRVVYVMGQGKSGSTILGVALGNVAGFFYAGELTSWLMTSGRPIVGGLERRRFWRMVRRRVPEADTLFGASAFHLLERSLAAVRPDRLARRRRLRVRYGRVQDELFAAVAAESGADCVIDSSHLPLRGLELERVEGLDVRLLFLVRDPEAVIASHTRYVGSRNPAARRRAAVVASAHLWFTYLLCTLVFLRHPRGRRLLVRHEDLLAEPEAVLGQIRDWAGSDAELPALDSLRTGVPYQGNPGLLRESEVTLRRTPDRPYRSSLLLRATHRPLRLWLAALGPQAQALRTGRATARILEEQAA